MDDEGKIPRLLVFLFGEAAQEPKYAALAQRGASSRLRRWAEAFEDWLDERKQNYRAGAAKQAALAWRRLLGEQGKMPWELRQADFEGHAAWMEAQGYARTTIANALGYMASFYRWCDERQIDPEGEAGFNPAAGARRPKIQRYAGAKLLSEGEAEKLLGILRRDSSALGKRDYAFFLARLRLGAPLGNLQQLRWGQINGDEGGAWVRWREGGERVQLPGEVWEAMRTWLATSGQLEGMEEGDYIFTPLVDPLREQTGDQPGTWAKGRYLTSSQILRNLKLYGRGAGIEEEKLTLMALRRTAIRMRLGAGGSTSLGDGTSLGGNTSLGDGTSLQEMQAFLDSREEAKFTKSRLRRLPEMPEEGGEEAEAEAGEAAVPLRKARPFQPGEGLKHGLYAHDQPAEAVRAVVKEDIQGIEEEIEGLRRLSRGLVEMQGKATSSKEMGQLAEAFTLTAERLAKMIEAEKRLAKDGEADSGTEKILAVMDRCAEENGEAPVSGAIRAEALGDTSELAINTRRLVEEAAATRLVLRNTLRAAREAEQKGEVGEYIRMTDIYSSGCNRLMKLLRAGDTDQGRLKAYVMEMIDGAIREVTSTWEIVQVLGDLED